MTDDGQVASSKGVECTYPICQPSIGFRRQCEDRLLYQRLRGMEMGVRVAETRPRRQDTASNYNDQRKTKTADQRNSGDHYVRHCGQKHRRRNGIVEVVIGRRTQRGKWIAPGSRFGHHFGRHSGCHRVWGCLGTVFGLTLRPPWGGRALIVFIF